MVQPVKDAQYYLKSGKSYSDQVGHLERRAAFRRYVDKSGLLDKLTWIFMDLYECPATDFPVTEYVRTSLADKNPDREKFATLRQRTDEAESFRDRLRKDIERLKAALETAAEHE